ncbi:hypothetical protein MPLSOD_510003 [Mesorhizobium sp. SOD10]|nr:hypothetical protein MPLSOD_510003 [Mesorhizobium sp. SOD10]
MLETKTLRQRFRYPAGTGSEPATRAGRAAEARKKCKADFGDREGGCHMPTLLKEWHGQQGSNLRPAVLETAALPTELCPCMRLFGAGAS